MSAVLAQKTTMKAIVYHAYGEADVLELREIDKPVPADDEVLVRIHAASVNPVDWHMMSGSPYLVRLAEGLRAPRGGRLGGDYAGTVEAVGGDVTRFEPGDEVFGVRNGAFAEYVCVRDGRGIAPKPAHLTFEQAGALGVAGLTALQGLRDKGGLRAGQKVLINGASGGVGTFAVQIAKAAGAEVTGVCSTDKVEIARSLGADRVIDYTREDFTLGRQRHDLMLDIAGNRSWSDCKRVLTDEATVVIVGGPKTNRWIGSFGRTFGVWLASVAGSRTVRTFIAKSNREHLEALLELVGAGSVTPVIDRRYELGEVPDALGYIAQGHARGKVVISL